MDAIRWTITWRRARAFGRGCLVTLAWLAAEAAMASEPVAGPTVDPSPAAAPMGLAYEAVIDLRDESDPRLVSHENAEIRWESDETMYWAPRERHRMAEIVYRIDLPAPIAAIVSSDAFGVVAYNEQHDSGKAFDPGCSARLDVSVDGRHWIPLDSSYPGAPRETRDIRDIPELVGARQLFFRAQLRVTKLHARDLYRYAQFLRGHPARLNYPRIGFVLRDSGRGRPVDVAAGTGTGKEKTPWQGMPRGR